MIMVLDLLNETVKEVKRVLFDLSDKYSFLDYKKRYINLKIIGFLSPPYDEFRNYDSSTDYLYEYKKIVMNNYRDLEPILKFRKEIIEKLDDIFTKIEKKIKDEISGRANNTHYHFFIKEITKETGVVSEAIGLNIKALYEDNKYEVYKELEKILLDDIIDNIYLTVPISNKISELLLREKIIEEVVDTIKEKNIDTAITLILERDNENKKGSSLEEQEEAFNEYLYSYLALKTLFEKHENVRVAVIIKDIGTQLIMEDDYELQGKFCSDLTIIDIEDMFELQKSRKDLLEQYKKEIRPELILLRQTLRRLKTKKMIKLKDSTYNKLSEELRKNGYYKFYIT